LLMNKNALNDNSTWNSKHISQRLTFTRSADGILLIRCAGNWQIRLGLPSIETVQYQIDSHPRIQRLVLDMRDLKQWDSGLVSFLLKVIRLCERQKIRVQTTGMPEGIHRLLKLALAADQKEYTNSKSPEETMLSRIGTGTINFFGSAADILAFVGEASLAFLKFITGRARFRRSDLILLVQETGVDALPIVSLISLLVGLILAFVGAIQLKMFGAQIYVANLVGISMVRVMGAVMTGIIVAGRTGAAFAAQLGTMQVNEEIDALSTLGISPMEFLVMPRMVALVLMMPLLCLYADLVGILGGMIVAVGMLDLNILEYYNQTKLAVSLNDFWIGLVHGVVFGVLVSLSGCLRGIQCGRSAQAVGYATTSAVVTGIVSIIVATAIITVICNELGI